MNGLGANYNYYGNRLGFGTSVPLRDITGNQQIQPNLNNIGIDVPVSPEISPKLPNFGITLNRKNIEEKEDKSKNGKLDLSEIGKNLLKGAGGFAMELVKHPIKSLAVAAGIGVLTTLCPPLGGIMIAGAAMGGVFSFGGGILKAGVSLARKDWDGFEKSFEDTGSGLSTMIMSGFMARGFNKLLPGSKNLSKFKLSPEGITTWAKESYGLVKKLGTENYRSALNLAQANLKGFINAIKPQKGEAIKFLDRFKSSRAEVIENIHNSALNNENRPTGLLDKIRFKFAKSDEGKADFLVSIGERLDIDRNNLKLSNNIMDKIPKTFENAWTYLPDGDKSASGINVEG